MEKKIIENLDKLTPEQAESLLEGELEMKVNDWKRNRIKNSVFEKAGMKKQKKIYIPKRLVACICAFAIIFTTISVVGANNVSAAIRDLFTFIPGFGITDTEGIVYMIDPVTRQSKAGNAMTNIVRAVYLNGYLNITIEVNEMNAVENGGVKTDVSPEMPFYENFSLYVNGLRKDYQDEPSSASLSWSSRSVMLNIAYKTTTPESNDIYEIEVTGFPERLSFKMIPCRSYEDIKKIGPTDIQNEISITATAQRIDGRLIVWCYPFLENNKIRDRILGFGQSANGSFVMERYVETRSGNLLADNGGWTVSGRFIYNISEEDTAATLHIPYLAMLREEKAKLKVKLPKDYSTAYSGIAAETSLGTIRVTDVVRETNKYDSTKDTIKIYFDFDSKDENMRFYSFDFNFYDFSCAKHFDTETGCLDFLEIYVNKKDSKVTIDISQLYYYMFGEYVIELDIQ